ncbi:MAG: C4-dicarboxylic acid transporter DauA [Coriobacteriia bacterium]|nr:C4-dicarboxylic acid transporter DauA [Coriobacteriia bacterium]
MPHREHLTTVRLGSALSDVLRDRPYRLADLGRDALAGLTVGVIAVPLAMALAVASGAPPQNGLFTAAVAGLVAALAGGSRFSVSGPTAAFVVILEPVARRYGMAGLGTATLFAGVILIGLGSARLGRLIEYIPEPVTVGFTSGIASVIAILQVNDFLGLGITDLPEHTLAKAAHFARAAPNLDPAALAVGGLTLLAVVLWPRERLVIPGHVPALALGIAAALLLAKAGHTVDTIGSRFTFALADGGLGHGIPRALPSFALPWNQAGAGGAPLTWSLPVARELLSASLSIAVLGAIESLLCAVVLDRSTGTRHHANGEMLGQGLANVVAPFFGGIPATAALARSAANVKAGARTPLAAALHALVVLLGMLALAPLLSLVPMASMAALLLTVAWNMSEADKAVTLARTSPGADRLVLLSCLVLTVAFDMVVAITAGVVLAALLFMRDASRFTQVRDITASEKHVRGGAPSGWKVYKITGALFFAAADRVLAEVLSDAPDGGGIVLYADGVTVLDAGGAASFERFTEECASRDIELIVADLQPQPLRTARAAGLFTGSEGVRLAPTLAEGLLWARLAAAPTGRRTA